VVAERATALRRGRLSGHAASLELRLPHRSMGFDLFLEFTVRAVEPQNPDDPSQQTPHG
jgi:hypothetical protein